MLEGQRGYTFVHPFDDPRIIAGQGTTAIEMFADVPAIDTLVTPIGGGGLISGMATVARAQPHAVEVIGVEAELFPSMYNRIKRHRHALRRRHAGRGYRGQGAGRDHQPHGRRPGRRHRPRLGAAAGGGGEPAPHRSRRRWSRGAGAAGLAALLAYPERFAGRTVGVVLCGGNIDTRLLANVLLRDLARSGRLARLRIRLQDQPGALFNVARIFDQERVNIIEVYHQRVFTTLPAKGLITDIECEARDRHHLDRLVTALRDAGYEVSLVELA